jgi:hypothetical protein
MSLDQEPLDDMGGRGPTQEACLFPMAQEGNRGRPVDGELGDRWRRHSSSVSRTFIGARVQSLRPNYSPTVNAAAGPISLPA